MVSNTPPIVCVSLRSVPSPGARQVPPTVATPVSSLKSTPRRVTVRKPRDDKKHYKSRGTQVSPGRFDDLMKLKSTQTDSSSFTVTSIEVGDKKMTSTLGIQTSPETENVEIENAHDFFERQKKKINGDGKKEKSRKLASRLTLFERSKIVKEVNKFWERKEKVTAEAIRKWAKSSIQYRFGLAYFRVVLSGLGFCFKKLDRMSVIQDRPNIISARMRYLTRKGQLNDENAYFAAFDETWAHDGMVARMATL
ncbi:hypothetical protein CRE_28667 [Caenorhabditis remanei]|uniref:Uncharacterized protein n=1 Tax=Caenorhabditis remanei TaxID=31234 RepID=E3MJX7_CAERE|nr:hypothetical protein CRE_28667 [Caenorhabditis remanei]